VERAKEEGFFDEEEAKKGLTIRRLSLDEAEVLEAVDEEGNVIAGEVVRIDEAKSEGSDLVGDLASFIAKGMPVEEPLKELGNIFSPDSTGEKHQAEVLSPSKGPSTKHQKNPKSKIPTSKETISSSSINIHTIDLPEEAPKQLLLELKSVLERFPGKERIQLKIGQKEVALPLTVTMSTILEKKIEEVMARYALSSK